MGTYEGYRPPGRWVIRIRYRRDGQLLRTHSGGTDSLRHTQGWEKRSLQLDPEPLFGS